MCTKTLLLLGYADCSSTSSRRLCVLTAHPQAVRNVIPWTGEQWPPPPKRGGGRENVETKQSGPLVRIFKGSQNWMSSHQLTTLSLSLASPIQSIYPHPTSWRSILILSAHLRLGLPSGLLPSGFPTKTLYTPSPYPYTPHAQPFSFFSILSLAQYWVRSTNHLAPRYAISSIPRYLFLPNYSKMAQSIAVVPFL